MAASAPPWLTVIGIGDDGLDGLPASTQALIAAAPVVAAGARALSMLPTDPAQTRIAWTTTEETVAAILARRGSPVVVVASGDPLHFGLGATLTRVVAAEEMRVIPHPSSFSLAAARLGWPLQGVHCRSAHGRAVAPLVLDFTRGARLLILLSDGTTAAAIARLLTVNGYGHSRLTALSHLGGPAEARQSGIAATWHADLPDLTLLAVECRLDPGVAATSRVPGLPDDAFEHDGQITKREVRAVTLAALGPTPGALLWDIGAGAGSIGIEWLRAVPTASAVAIERDPERLARIARNAERLGVPQLQIVAGDAPDILPYITGPAPDAVFIGGGLSQFGMLEAAWTVLGPGGRLVANAVTVEGESRLLEMADEFEGELRRIRIERTRPVGGLTVWDPFAPVTQLVAEKPR